MSARDYPQPRCSECGLFVGYDADNYTPFGGTGFEGLDPHDPEYLCNKHSKAEYKRLLKAYRGSYRGGDYLKSKAEIRAAREAGLEWVHSTGFVDLRTERDVSYCYILASDKKFYEPYLDWHAKHPRHDFWLPESKNCRRCGADWKTGHTSGTEYCHQFNKLTQVNDLQASNSP